MAKEQSVEQWELALSRNRDQLGLLSLFYRYERSVQELRQAVRRLEHKDRG